MDGKTLKPDLRVPDQKTASLSFCDTSPKAFKAWVSQLPMANIGEASRQLYHAIIELNQLFIPPQQRFQLLEMIRPSIRFVSAELSRHYLGLAVALPEKQKKIANLSQALQLHCASGYKICVLEFIDNGGIEKNRKGLATSIHRAVSELGATIIRSYQLYCRSPAQSWLECHRLFRFAHRNKLLGLSVDDDTLTYRKISTIEDSYKRILLVGCSRPNQLRQSELIQAYELFETLTQHSECEPDINKDSLFVIDMERDAPPVYRSLLEQKPGADTFAFDTRELSQLLVQPLKEEERQNDSSFQIPAGFSETLLNHLGQALGVLAKRNFNRISSQGTLQVCVGLTAVHFFVSGEKSFNEFINGSHTDDGDEENLFIRAARTQGDAWSGAHDAGPSEERLHSADTPINFRSSLSHKAEIGGGKTRPLSHQALLVNASPGGYCVAWESNVPSHLQAGEIVGVRELPSHPWSIAVVRWIRHAGGHRTQIGLELLAPSASPCGVKLVHKVGNSSEYLRGLLLPEINAVNQPASVLTPRLPFQSGSRISLLQHEGREDNGQLVRKLSATGSISQFELKLYDTNLQQTKNPPPGTGTNDDEFDSLWPSL